MTDNTDYLIAELEHLFNEEEKTKRTIRTLVIIIAVLVILLAVFVVLYITARDKAENAMATIKIMEVEKVVKDYADNDPEVRITENRLYFKDGLFGEAWLPILKDVEPSTIEKEHLYLDENGIMSYCPDYENEAIFGIDVSYHQKNIDWEAVAASGVEFAMVRAGYRGYETGKISLDEDFHKNVRGALENGIDVGVYFFSQAVTVDEAIEEAEILLAELEGYDITYPVVYDWEIIGVEPARTDDVSARTATNCAVAFCEMIKDAGYKPMIYASRRMAYFKFDLSRLKDYDFWLAEYSDEPTMYYNFDMWQYSCEGQIDGIEGEIDMNICFKDYSKEEEEAPPEETTVTTTAPETTTAEETSQSTE